MLSPAPLQGLLVSLKEFIQKLCMFAQKLFALWSWTPGRDRNQTSVLWCLVWQSQVGLVNKAGGANPVAVY